AICARVVFPDLLSGLYTPEEMLSVENIPGQVDQNGDVIPFEKATNPLLINQSGAKRNESENKPSSLALEPQVPANNASEDTSLDNKIPNNTVSIPPSENQQLNTCDNSTVFAPNKTTPDVPLDSMCCGSGSDSEISQIEDLLADGARWNGKIYKGNTIYIANRKFSLSVVDIEHLKEICGKLALRQHSHELKSDDRDDLPF
ncbi:MAG: hypothetical protein Q8858_12260, partial [Bacteroidota bacterium]|nr:hypothetical protein [Bacteroidota bacterium]